VRTPPIRSTFHEWLVTNGLGGYASGSISGALTRRFHGLLVAALPVPLGRPEFLLSGSPDEVCTKIEALAAAGVQQIQFNFLDCPGTESIELFLNEILPRFR